jgi:hypothetical protein
MTSASLQDKNQNIQFNCFSYTSKEYQKINLKLVWNMMKKFKILKSSSKQNNARLDVDKLEHLVGIIGGTIIWCSHCRKWWGKKYQMYLSYDPAIPVVCAYPKELNARIQTYICSRVLITNIIQNRQKWKL